MISTANSNSISLIFSSDSPFCYEIPRYQREYTWGKYQWEALFDDISDTEGYFIGSIISISNRENSGHGVQRFELVDGQQRLTTISILFCAIYDKLTQIENILNNDQKGDLWNLRNRIINKIDKITPKITLSSQNNNNEDYKFVLKQIGLIDDTFIKPRNFGNRSIGKCFNYFQKRIEEYDIEKTFKLLSSLNSSIVVVIVVDSYSNAFTLFESLNNRGVPLTAIDLIKNKLLSKISGEGELEVNRTFEKWKNIVDNLSDDYVIQERFLRQFYNAYKYDNRIKIENQTKATRSNLIQIYEKLIERDNHYIFDELYQKSKIYQQLTQCNSEDSELNALLKSLSRIKAAPSYTLLMYIINSKSNEDLSLLKEIVRLLIKYFVRRNLVDFPSTRDLDKIFIDLIEILKENNNYSYQDVEQYFLNPLRIASLEKFKEKLNGDIYLDNIDTSRFILAEIERNNSENRENKRDFWEKERNNILIWTIEHIFPEGDKIPEEWINSIADGDSERATILQNQYVHKIGNLTLTGFNQHLSNFAFPKKRDREKDGKYIGYKNGLFLNKYLSVAEQWTIQDIETRTNFLIEESIKLFRFNDLY